MYSIHGRFLRMAVRYQTSSRNCFSTPASRKAKTESERKKIIYIGAPLIIFLIGGSYLLSIFLETHFEMKDKQNSSSTVRSFDLEQEHKELMKKLDIDNFSLSRIPRPEENSEADKHTKGKNAQATK